MFNQFNFKQKNMVLIVSTILLCTAIVFAATIWRFDFTASIAFPNPAGSGDQVKESMSLLILDTDYNFYPANIRSVVYNVIGQKVYEKVELHQSSPNFQMIVWKVGNNTPSGVYTIKVRAESAVAGNSSWIVRRVTIVN
ncbi:hypothetical protein J7K93_02060 [bacterium]|nr:hypothetical protein [bacterium]